MAASNLNYHLVESQATVKEWLSQFLLTEDFTSKKFLDLKVFNIPSSNVGGVKIGITVTNFDKIKSQYTSEELKASGDITFDNQIIKAGTTVAMPNGSLKRNVMKSKILPDLSTLTESKPFIADALRGLFEDPNYISVLRNNDGEQVAKTQINDITVYAWIRSLTVSGDDSQDGTWYDVSACVEFLETTVTKEVGSFSMSVVPALAKYNGIKWTLSNILGYDTGNIREDVLGTASISKYRNRKDNFLARNDFFFSRILQENDLIYIRFEGLVSEKFKDSKKTFGGQDVPGKIYDMIGLVDHAGESDSKNNVVINVVGRDLMKLLIEDGSQFFPEQIAQQIFTNPNSILTKRNKVELDARVFTGAAISFKPVSEILKFIFNKFSNLGLVPSSVFNGYGDRAVKEKYRLSTDNQAVQEINSRFAKEERQGLWKILEFVFDKSAAKRVLADSTVSTDNGSIINSIRKVCQEPFVEFFGDTYGDKYYFNVRKPPFDEKGYKGMVFKDTVSEEIGDGVNGNSNISQISKFDGLGKLKKVTPFPNTDLAKKLKQKTLLSGRPATISDLVIDIDEVDVITDSLDYSDEIYTWYRVIPRGLGVSDNITSFQLAPIIPLDEYAEIWGNKTYTIEYNYCASELIDDSFANKEMKYSESQAFLDLQYIIQSHVYLPFTRQGTIRINGDRRIKRGAFIYYKPTDEVYYVDAVTNTRQLNDRFTTLRVSRGMRLKYIKGVMVNFGAKVELVSYFSIVPTVIENNASINNHDFLKNWRVNKNVMNFFLQRRQWVE